jgi:GAF domain-containing protein
MSAVSEIARAVNAAEPLEEVLNRVAAQACELIGFEFCAVMLADEQRQRLHIGGCSGLSPHYLAQVSGGRSLWTPQRPGPTARTARSWSPTSGTQLATGDCRTWPRPRGTRLC